MLLIFFSNQQDKATPKICAYFTMGSGVFKRVLSLILLRLFFGIKFSRDLNNLWSRERLHLQIGEDEIEKLFRINITVIEVNGTFSQIFL